MYYKMTRRKVCIIILLVILSIVFTFFSLNFYFLTKLNNNTNKYIRNTVENVSIKKLENIIERDIKDLIVENVAKLHKNYKLVNPKFHTVQSKLLDVFQPKTSQRNISELWDIANKWPVENRIYPLDDSRIGEIIKVLQSGEVIGVDTSSKGTQLKLQLTLSGNQVVIFKPKWYPREEIIEGSVFSGKDRHNSEIFAFYLGALLGLNWTPIAVGRRFNLKELYALSSEKLRKTFVINNFSYCFYGECYYCNSSNLVCGLKDDGFKIEGVLLYLIPGPFSKKRSPWQRTYKEGVSAEWETNQNYCESFVKEKLSENQILDLIDASVFDFLIQNGDRHHYETRKTRILLLDNGKGLGNPYKDFVDVLAPLYQCCMIRKKTYERLTLLTGGKLSESIKKLTKNDLLHPIATDDHFRAIDRRLLIIFSAIESCFKQKNHSMFY